MGSDTDSDLANWSKAGIQFFVLTNAGAAVATLSFIGSSGQAPWPAIVSLGLFVVGLMLAGLTILGQWTYAWTAWLQRDMPAAPVKGSWFVKLGQRIEPRTGTVLGWSFIAFIAGAVAGLVALVLY